MINTNKSQTRIIKVADNSKYVKKKVALVRVFAGIRAVTTCLPEAPANSEESAWL